MTTATYETSKKLFDAGLIKQEECDISWFCNNLIFKSESGEYEGEIVPAPTFDEIWTLLPDKIYHSHCTYWLTLEKETSVDNINTISYFSLLLKMSLCAFDNTNLAEAAALMLLWLHQNKYL